MGVVHLARDRRLGRLVALKMIRADKRAGRDALSRFRAEAEAVARLKHPHIVQIHEIGETEGRPFLSLEYVEHGSLDGRIKQAPLPPVAAARLVEIVARAMHHAHQHGIVHRDLKPANVLLAPAEPAQGIALSAGGATAPWFVPKVADLGLAKRLDDDSGQTHQGTVVGTPCYMAPEQVPDPVDGRLGVIGPATDVYALGAVLCDCLVGRPPFKGSSTLETLGQVLQAEPIPPHKLQPHVHRDLSCTRRPRTGRRLGDPVRTIPVNVVDNLAPVAAQTIVTSHSTLPSLMGDMFLKAGDPRNGFEVAQLTDAAMGVMLGGPNGVFQVTDGSFVSIMSLAGQIIDQQPQSSAATGDANGQPGSENAATAAADSDAPRSISFIVPVVSDVAISTAIAQASSVAGLDPAIVATLVPNAAEARPAGDGATTAPPTATFSSFMPPSLRVPDGVSSPPAVADTPQGAQPAVPQPARMSDRYLETLDESRRLLQESPEAYPAPPDVSATPGADMRFVTVGTAGSAEFAGAQPARPDLAALGFVERHTSAGSDNAALDAALHVAIRLLAPSLGVGDFVKSQEEQRPGLRRVPRP
jgi:serine/threonine protein kinase